MKKTLLISVLAALAVGASTLSMAQTAGPSGTQGTINVGAKKGNHKAHGLALWRRGERDILPTLGLTKDQMGQVKALNKKTEASQKELRANTIDKKELRAKTQEAFKAYQDAFLAILTPDQGKQFKEKLVEYSEKLDREAAAAAAAPGNTAPATTTPGNTTPATGTGGGTGH
jgi:Spy/CpxP family protein refolding chaperone